MAILHLTEENIDTEIANSTVPMIIDFWASWCGPCKMLAPILEEIDKENNGTVQVCKVEIDEQPQLAMRFKIQNVPTLIFYRDGKETNKMVGIYMDHNIKQDILDAANTVTE